MKKTLAIVLALAVALTLGVIAFAEDISDVLSSAPVEVEEPTVADEAIEAVPAEEAPAEEAPAEEAPAEDVPAEEVPAEEATNSKVMHVTSNGYFTAEEAAFINAVLGKRIEVGYASYDIDEYGNRYECYNYELPAEIAEKYGTRDCEKLPTIYIFESRGEFDSTETFEMYYGSRDYYFEGEALKHTDTIKRTVVYEVVIPAGGVAFCVLDPGDDTLLGGKNISATYGDLTLIFDD